MIISWKHRYIFVAIHHTASTVIEEELCRYYEGVRARHKHSLPIFLPASVRGFKVVGGVRNPVSDVVAQYNKYATNHRGIYSAQISGEAKHQFMTQKARFMFQKIQDGEMSLEDFITKASRIPYVPRVELNRSVYSYIYKMENLRDEFSKIIAHCGLQQVRDLPAGNPTSYIASMENADELLKSRLFRAAAVRYGYLLDEVPLSEGLAYSAARTAKTNVWAIREMKAILKNSGFYKLESSVADVVPDPVKPA
jgi:hypothetical protein